MIKDNFSTQIMLTDSELDAMYCDTKAWESAWLAGKTDWWPDTIKLQGSEAILRSGCPSSEMPELAQSRIAKLRDAKQQYVQHVSSGVHAYRIGVVGEFKLVNDFSENLPSKPIQAVIVLDEGLRDSMSQDERNDSMTNLFMGLTKAVQCGARVDLSDPARIVVTKLEV